MKSIELDETRNLAWTNLGVAYARLGKFREAVDQFDAALRLDDRDQLAIRNRALAYKKLGEFERADADFARAKELAGVGGE